jgi:hypothetical protein
LQVAFKIFMTITIKPTPRASKRTKERIKQRGPVFVVERMHDTESLGMRVDIGQVALESWLLREVGGPDGDTWVGWLPLDEFEIISA